jgi:Ser/Thr protein kinase RdoA (MazF antagonist)
MLPAARREAANAALEAAFGRRAIGPLTLLKGGVSGALIYRVEIGERPYVLRLEPERIPLQHRRRGFDCMAAAAAVGVAPAVRFADAGAGVAVIDFIDGRPLAEHPGGQAGLTRDLGGLVARIQQTPRFPWLAEEGDMIAALLTALAGSGLFEPGLLAPHAEGLARLRRARPYKPAAFVSSHNDPNPRNMLFDGQRVWLVDWELACRNDSLFDVAILTLDLAATPELEAILLTAAFGRPPDRVLRAQVAVTRLLARLFYGCIALEAFTGQPRAGPDASLDGLTPSEFQRAAAEGRFASGEPDIAYAFGKMSLAAFLAGLSAPGFAETLALASEG